MRSDRLKNYRVKRNYTQEALALELGTDKKAVSRWESGQFSPNAETLTELSRILSVSVDYLLGLSDSPTPQMRVDNLTEEELEVINAMRQGERMEAIKIIASR
jgi:transcriptional regulator with XRE-family HTH domain